MSSIRPLATITVLVAFGVFLYLKINETEPVLPEGVGDFQMSGDVDFDMQSDSSGMDEVPGFATASSGDAAPPFSPNVAAAPATEAPAFASQAPTETVAATAPPFGTETTAPPVAGQATSPPLPPLPSLPPTAHAHTDEAPHNHSAEASHSHSDETGHAHSAEAGHAEPTANSIAAVATAEATPPALAVPDDIASNTGASSPAVADHADHQDHEHAPASVAEATAPAGISEPVAASSETRTPSSLFSATRLAVQAALDRGELSQALLLLSDWYGDPSLSANEKQEVEQLLSQLAGSVIYSTEHRLEPPYMVQAGERLEDIARAYQVPWQLLAKINGIADPNQLQPGQQLKVLRGPFSAVIDLSQRKITLMLDRRYAGQFSLELEPTTSLEEGDWAVNQKLLTPAVVSPQTTSPVTPTADRALTLTNTSGGTNQMAILRSRQTTGPSTGDPPGRVLRLSPRDIDDVFDILSLGSRVTIRR